LNVSNFDYDTSEAVRDEALSANNVADKLSNHISGMALRALPAGGNQGLERVSDVPIYFADAIVRRASALQKTRDAASPCVAMHGSELQRLGVSSGDTVKISQGNGSVRLRVQANDLLPAHTVHVAAGHPATAALGAMFGTITVEQA